MSTNPPPEEEWIDSAGGPLFGALIGAIGCGCGGAPCAGCGGCACQGDSGEHTTDPGWASAFGIEEAPEELAFAMSPDGWPDLANWSRWGDEHEPDESLPAEARERGEDDDPPDKAATAVAMVCAPTVFSMPEPSFLAANTGTQGCFQAQFGPLLDWPPTACCPPRLRGKHPACVVPNLPFHGYLQLYSPGLFPFPGVAAPPLPTATGIAEVAAVYEAGVKILQDNLDIVEWVLCLVASYSPDVALRGTNLVGEVADLVTGVTRSFLMVTGGAGNPFAFTYHDPVTKFPGGGVGVVLPEGVANPLVPGFWWQNLRDKVVRGNTTDAFCAGVSASIEILHEMVHIVMDYGNGLPGSNHAAPVQGNKCPGCWDECRMVDSAYQWAVSQRFPCLTTTCASCFVDAAAPVQLQDGLSLNDPWSFLFSGCHQPWHTC